MAGLPISLLQRIAMPLMAILFLVYLPEPAAPGLPCLGFPIQRNYIDKDVSRNDFLKRDYISAMLYMVIPILWGLRNTHTMLCAFVW